PFKIPAGKHTLVVENPAGPDWFELAHLVFDLDVPALASIGQRNDSFIALWLWDRANVFSLEQPATITGKVEIGDVPAGRWEVVWWDTLKGVPSAPVAIEHAGGTLSLPTPPIVRHAAVVLSKM
ncbi:MAG TPA: hypothetical protein VFJ90_08970, partial [Candidatus Didemnitutus sp.]|nr:hypothetical protein [Candidatus Didemnitutus sp.]